MSLAFFFSILPSRKTISEVPRSSRNAQKLLAFSYLARSDLVSCVQIILPNLQEGNGLIMVSQSPGGFIFVDHGWQT